MRLIRMGKADAQSRAEHVFVLSLCIAVASLHHFLQASGARLASTDDLTRLLYSARSSWYSFEASALAGELAFGSERSD